ncbi:MAG: hypothetical protein R2713_07625 [Ilumatobacteraceae bacterium]
MPANAKAVALNVTVTEPSTGSYLTVFPTGDPPARLEREHGAARRCRTW